MGATSQTLYTGADLKSLMEAYERQLIVAALAANGGNQRRAAASLGVLPTTLHEKMKRLGLRPRRMSVLDLAQPESPRPS